VFEQLQVFPALPHCRGWRSVRLLATCQTAKMVNPHAADLGKKMVTMVRNPT